MKYSFEQLVDVKKLQQLTDDLYDAVSIPSAIITMEGKILTGSGWQRICTDFHRQHPEIEKECIKSDIKIRKHLDAGDKYVMYKCPRGLVDASSPIIIEGEHVANVFAGQLFIETPDETTEKYFLEQAVKFGFKAEDYMDAYHEIPVFPEEQFKSALRFLVNFAKLVADIGLLRLKELEALDDLYSNERKYKRLLDSTNAIPWELDIATGNFTYMGPQAVKVFGYPLEYWKDMTAWADTILPEDRDWAVQFCMCEAKAGRDHEFEYHTLTQDGRVLLIRDVVSVIMGEKCPEKLIGFMHDITERKQSEEALIHSHELMSYIIEHNRSDLPPFFVPLVKLVELPLWVGGA